MHRAGRATPAAAAQQRRVADVVADVAHDGWSLVGALDQSLTLRLRRAVGEVAAALAPPRAGSCTSSRGSRSTPTSPTWSTGPPLLAAVLDLLSPNVYINHSRLGVPPAAPAGRGPPVAPR